MNALSNTIVSKAVQARPCPAHWRLILKEVVRTTGIDPLNAQTAFVGAWRLPVRSSQGTAPPGDAPRENAHAAFWLQHSTGIWYLYRNGVKFAPQAADSSTTRNLEEKSPTMLAIKSGNSSHLRHRTITLTQDYQPAEK